MRRGRIERSDEDVVVDRGGVVFSEKTLAEVLLLDKSKTGNVFRVPRKGDFGCLVFLPLVHRLFCGTSNCQAIAAVICSRKSSNGTNQPNLKISVENHEP